MSARNMIRWSGLALILAGFFLAFGTLVHPSNETPATIIRLEARLIAGHWLLTLFAAFFLLGLPGVYASHANQFGRLGLTGFILIFFGTLFYSVSSDYGFNAPVLARLAPETLSAINAYPSVILMDALFVLFLLVGFILFGISIVRSHIFYPWTGILIILGWPIFMIASAIALLVYEPVWILAIAGAFMLGFGIGGVGYELWTIREKNEILTSGQ